MPAKREYKYTDGNVVPEGRRINPDHHVQTFVVQLRTMGGVSAEMLTRKLQDDVGLEVTNLTETEHLIYVQK